MKTMRTIAAISLSVLLLAIVFVYIDNNDIDRRVYSQQTTENMFPNNTETATEFEDVIEGNNTAILENDTDIGNPNNTLSTDVETGAETLGSDVETGAETLGSDVETGAETLDQDIIILGEDSKTMLKNEIDEIEQIGKQDFDALLAKIKSLQIP
jgi:hypothetical protein